MIDLGDITVRGIVEQQAPFMHVSEFFPDLDAERLDPHRHWMEPDFLDTATQKIVLCVQSYLVRTKHHTILIDACVGNHKNRPTRPFWDQMTSDRYEKNLKSAGVTFEEIDYVMCTHLHTDHVGGTRDWRTGVGCRPFRTRNICLPTASLPTGPSGPKPILKRTLGSSIPCCPSLRRNRPRSSKAIMSSMITLRTAAIANRPRSILRRVNFFAKGIVTVAIRQLSSEPL